MLIACMIIQCLCTTFNELINVKPEFAETVIEFAETYESTSTIFEFCLHIIFLTKGEIIFNCIHFFV